MDIEVVHQDNAVVVSLRGRIIDGESAEELRKTLQRLILAGSLNTIVDLEQVTWFDSLAIGLLVTHHVSLSKRGGRTVLLHANDKIRQLMRLAHLEDRFEWASTLEQAVGLLEAC